MQAKFFGQALKRSVKAVLLEHSKLSPTIRIQSGTALPHSRTLRDFDRACDSDRSWSAQCCAALGFLLPVLNVPREETPACGRVESAPELTYEIFPRSYRDPVFG